MDQRFSKSEKTLSFIYYPRGNFVPVGHAEMETGGTIWNGGYSSRLLTKAIASATTHGLPFFRFVLKAKSDQTPKIEIDQYIYKSRDSITCSRAALYPLSKMSAISIPFPINMSPLSTALYLTAGTALRINGVKRIEYYGNPSLTSSLVKMLPGIAVEMVLNCTAGFTVSFISYIMYLIMRATFDNA
jgi:hypothetical protein